MDRKSPPHDRAPQVSSPSKPLANVLSRLPQYAYVSELFRGRRVLEIGCGDGYASHFLASHGAAQVVGVDRSPGAIDAAMSRYRLTNLSFQVAELDALEVEDRSFDLVCVPSGGELFRWLGFLEEVRRVLSRTGQLLVAAPSADRPHARGGVSYHELVERLEPLFGEVRMIGVSPFVGLSLVEYGDGAEELDELELDTSLASLGGETDLVTVYLALAGEALGQRRGYTVVQLPPVAGLGAVAHVSGIEGDPRAPSPEARLREAEAMAADAIARLRDLEVAKTQQRGHQGEEAELKRRLAMAVEERTGADLEAQALRERISQAEEEIGRVTAQATTEVAHVRRDAAALATRTATLEAELSTARREILALRDERDATSATAAMNAVAQTKGRTAPPAPKPVPEPQGAQAVERLMEAAAAHERAMREAEARLSEQGAYIEELRAEVGALETRELAAKDRERDARSWLEVTDGELRQLRGHLARAEGETLRLRRERDEARAKEVRQGELETAKAELAAVQATLLERTPALEKATARWKEAESKSDELWRKIGEMQREMESMREQGVETARAQRQAAQVALTRAMEEAARKLVSAKDALGRTERERQELENLVQSLRADLGRQGEVLAARDSELCAARARLADAQRELDQIRAARTQVEVGQESSRGFALTRLGELEAHLRALETGLGEEASRLGSLEDRLHQAEHGTGQGESPSGTEA
jgi:SAM-dependent methyltransferase